MFCINAEQLYHDNKIRAVIQTDTTPETMPTTGAAVDGLANGAELAPGSILYAVAPGETYILGEDGETWTKWGAGTQEGGAE